MADGKRVKMVIDAYEQPDFTSPVGTYTFQINPEKQERTARPTVKNSMQVLSGGKSVPTNKPADVETLKLEFHIDATGMVPGCDDVTKNINQLRKLGLDVNGNIHRSNYLKIRWGEDFAFPCVMKDISVDFKLFKPDGSPVQARVTAVFEEFVDPSTQAKIDNTSSPDMTHVATVLDGDNLPLMCFRIYGDPKYYIQVAKHNHLTTVSSLKPGQKIVFPRLSHE
jgi:Contractile injection system tube protein